MKTWLSLAILAAALGCDRSTPPVPRVEGKVEPGRIRVLHVLIAFRGSERADKAVTRTQVEAEVLAKEVLARARRGEDFKKLIKDHTNDHGDGNYSLVNHGVVPRSGDSKRGDFAQGFCDVAFALDVGEVGMAPFDDTISGGRKRSPFGYHIIKRIE